VYCRFSKNINKLVRIIPNPSLWWVWPAVPGVSFWSLQSGETGRLLVSCVLQWIS